MDSLLSHVGLHPRQWVVAVEAVSVSRMYWLNATFRAKNRPTDILSFKQTDYCREDFARGFPPKHPVAPADLEPLGHLIICPRLMARRLRLRHPPMLDRRIERLLVHGVCHLLGHDHEKHPDYRQMLRLEGAMLAQLRHTRPVPRTMRRSGYLADTRTAGRGCRGAIVYDAAGLY